MRRHDVKIVDSINNVTTYQYKLGTSELIDLALLVQEVPFEQSAALADLANLLGQANANVTIEIMEQT